MRDIRGLFYVTPEDVECMKANLGVPWRERLPCGHEGHACRWPGGAATAFCAICDLDWERKSASGTWVTG